MALRYSGTQRMIRVRRLQLAIGITLVVGSVSEAGAVSGPRRALEIVERMVAAHGGMEKWASAPTVSFVDEFKSGSETTGTVSRVTVEQGRRRAYIDYPASQARLSWDGEKAWSENWSSPLPPRFLALLNYYFLNLPWLTQDPGVVLAEPATARLWDDPIDYLTLRMTFEAGVGDTPEDYYVLYIHPETHRLRACEYVVTYSSLLPAGTEASSPNILVFDEMTTMDGLTVPTHYTIHEPDRAVYASCDVRDWSFSEPFDESRMVMPEGAVIDDSTP